MSSKHHEMVAEFTRTFGHPIHDTPTRPSDKLRKLRIRLLREERDEFFDAVMVADYVETADGLGDMAVIAHGTLHAYGLPYVPGHRDGASNIAITYARYLDAEKAAAHTPGLRPLAAVGNELCQLITDIDYTATKLGIPFDAVFAAIHTSNMSKLGADGRPVYRADGKITKGPNYQPPQIAPLIIDAGLPVTVTAAAA